MNVKQSQLQLGCVRTGLSLDLEGGMQVHTGSQLSRSRRCRKSPSMPPSAVSSLPGTDNCSAPLPTIRQHAHVKLLTGCASVLVLLKECGHGWHIASFYMPGLQVSHCLLHSRIKTALPWFVLSQTSLKRDHPVLVDILVVALPKKDNKALIIRLQTQVPLLLLAWG